MRLRLFTKSLSKLKRLFCNCKSGIWTLRMHELERSPLGMQRLAGNYMLIQAIGEGIKKIDKYTERKIWAYRPEIPWRRVMGMRNRISHGYFDLDTSYIEDIIKNDLAPLLSAIDFYINMTSQE